MNGSHGAPNLNMDLSWLLGVRVGAARAEAAPQHFPQLEHTARSALC